MRAWHVGSLPPQCGQGCPCSTMFLWWVVARCVIDSRSRSADPLREPCRSRFLRRILWRGSSRLATGAVEWGTSNAMWVTRVAQYVEGCAASVLHGGRARAGAASSVESCQRTVC